MYQNDIKTLNDCFSCLHLESHMDSYHFDCNSISTLHDNLDFMNVLKLQTLNITTQKLNNFQMDFTPFQFNITAK